MSRSTMAASTVSGADEPQLAAERLEPQLADEERALLLDVARRALRVAVGTEPGATLESAVQQAAGLKRRAAAFVTLFEEGELRGCMGTLDHDRPVAESVAAAAVLAATEDPRFRPLTPGELAAVRLEVSVLCRPALLSDPSAFVTGRDGIIVERDWQRGLLLPQVAEEHGLDALGMFRVACAKAGLDGEAWRDPATRLTVFRVTRFEGEALPAT